jgi:hypothetical protein
MIGLLLILSFLLGLASLVGHFEYVLAVSLIVMLAAFVAAFFDERVR